jgi:hypothetical protein
VLMVVWRYRVEEATADLADEKVHMGRFDVA